MFLRKSSLFDKLIIGLAICICALVLLLFISYSTSDELYENFSLVEHTYKVEAQLESLILVLTRQESATRRFIITGDERSLWDIDETTKTLNYQLSQLTSMVSDNSLQTHRSYALRRLMQKKLFYLHKSVQVRKIKDYKVKDVIRLVQEGNTYMSQIMLMKNSMEIEQERLLKSRKDKLYKHFVHTNVSIYLAGIASVISIGLILFIIQKERSKQIKISNELQALDFNKNKFFSIISHDLRGPASGILKLTGFLKQENISAEDSRQIISLIESSSNRLVDLLENLLTWAKMQMTNSGYFPEAQNMKDISDLAIESLKLNASLKEISIENFVDEYYILADKNMVLTALRNLISNAIKFTHQKGAIVVSSERKGKYVHFYVKDNGVGMPDEIRNNLFQIGRNVSLKGTANEKGTGLGLILCKEFVEKNNGSISVESKLNEGCKFIITFPLHEAA